MIIDYGDALGSLHKYTPNLTYSVSGINYETLVWETPNVSKPTKQELDSEVARLQAEYDAKQYQRDRAQKYPTIEEQLDMQYWDSINGTTTWQDAINAVKAKYPKGA
jgi:hypothetical protein